MSTYYEITSFTDDNLLYALANDYYDTEDVKSHILFLYLFDYLKYIDTQSILIEFQYIDGDYLNDFASYYVKSFPSYKKYCKRLHFFKFNQNDLNNKFNSILKSYTEQEYNDFNKNYNGFIVAKPLPQTIIGRTVLRTYPNENGRRNYTCTKDYKVNLFGIELFITSLAFQEQDTVLAACATAALWCCFHKTCNIFGSPSPPPPPVVITKNANEYIHPTRPIPSHGLNVEQICNAIIHCSLEPEVIEIDESIPVSSIMYSYLSFGIPIILGIRIESLDRHAITINGYSLTDTPIIQSEGSISSKLIPSIALKINEFYAHDDQIGPFCKMIVTPSASPSDKSPIIFEGTWKGKDTGKYLRLYPEVIIIPVYHKIRLNYLDIHKWILKLTEVLEVFLQHKPEYFNFIEWDIKLKRSNELKKEIIQFIDIPQNIKEDLLLKSHPRYIWHAVLKSKNRIFLNLLFDATDNARAMPIYTIIWHDESFKNYLQSQLNQSGLKDLLCKILSKRFYKILVNN